MKQPQQKPHDRKVCREQRKSGHRYKIRADGKMQCRAQRERRGKGCTWITTANF
jgi:hypothetical protein